MKDRLSQSVTIPATATASLTFFLHITTEEQTTTQAFDKLRVQVRRANGQITTLQTFSNLQAVPGDTQEMVSLTSFKGWLDDENPSHKWGRSTEGGEAPVRQGATTEHTGSM